MATLTSILPRIERFLPTNRAVQLSDLRSLHTNDAEAVYELALHDLPEDAPIAARGLQRLSRTLSLLLREGFVVCSAANQLYATTSAKQGVLPLDDGDEDHAFLKSLYVSAGGGSKMESQERSSAFLAFILGEHSWDSGTRKTTLLRVEHDDARAVLHGLPLYQYHALLDSAREVVRCPSAVYRGLRHEGMLKDNSVAFCGRPSRRWTNHGAEAPRSGFVFLVFASADGCVFDWDWAPECKEHPGHPRNAQDRFPSGPEVNPMPGELLLGNIRGKTPEPFRPRHAWYSTKGDCVFWYLSDTESYADWYDEYLTAFFDASAPSHGDRKNTCVGFKLKSASRLIETVRKWAAPNSPEGIRVHFDPEKQEVHLAYLMKAWQNAALPRTQELFPGMRLMKDLGESGVAAIQTQTPPIALPHELLESTAIRS